MNFTQVESNLIDTLHIVFGLSKDTYPKSDLV
ncbi:hypothetical protein FJSC11DRAFT_1478 [Fischerella thermalis JSC-11]|jgi:hypothetical protein|uniref:Uncharacterized protein n=1 Tax=Fischerella thermalis JSC-11 TaxID=741277 RepID=G6FRI1_9CYAN|nr:hypothetical protein FJSC11DRAFT_1478 [Fischerella thermalis JSC-11]BAU04294.1 hypothetical protein FIS3754_01810 [Fischerella sp. NIES-3754]BCX06726.1 MAG: hypothetical protein KatS3mg066_0585 [Fischerella sp.]